MAEKLSQSMGIEHSWYADFKNEKFHYIIFRDKVFRVDMGSPKECRPVVEQGLSLGIPDYQLDFSPVIKDWEREA